MARKKRFYNPHVSKIQQRKITNLVRQYNAKITRSEKKYPSLKGFLPERIKTEDFYKKYPNRKDFLKEFESKQRFLRKGYETPVVTKANVLTSKYELNEIKILDRRKKKYKEKELQKHDISTEKGNMGTILENNLTYKKFDPQTKTRKELDKFIEITERMTRSDYNNYKAKLFHTNLIHSILTQAQLTQSQMENLLESLKYIQDLPNKDNLHEKILDMYNISIDEVNLYKKLINMNTDELVEFYYNNSQFVTPSFVYDDKNNTRQEIAETLIYKLK